MKELWYTMIYDYSNTWYHHLRFLKWIGDIIGSVFSPLISHMFLITCERPCQPVWDPSILAFVFTPLRTHGSSVLKRQSLWKQRPRENCVCVCLRVCVWRRERDERPLLWLHGEWTLLITMKLRSQTFYCRYCRLLPHTHTSSLCLLLFSLAPLLSLSSLSQWGKVFSAPMVRALIRLSAARACGRSRRSREQGALEETSSVST